MSCLAALTKFHEIYKAAFVERLGELPRCFTHGRMSPCLADGAIADSEAPQPWQMVPRHEAAVFDNVSHAMGIELHSDINGFYGHLFAGPLQFDSPWGEGELIQIWNEEDFVLLQQNILGHLMMKKQLKQPQTWFIGLIGDVDEMISVNNADGSVWREVAGQEPHEQLADSLEAFLQQLNPRVAPPQRHEEYAVAATPHPGIFASLKRMWHNLTGR
ncbi:SecY-interacting protein [Shewanella litorisediminis]|uniref:Protein Syd n=1 Tax=Shewanella litorisediminis TaxID=1173586 RepID=A0ABX7G6H3_9GAMM|nr:SecY-interacting protein [Shewanella litorisediminis]MCL2916979.1 SecY-interacting protein [Shewanella litorisediminis]QRH02863.1 SecY-interacting protein [Shewanella litorisediminis]